MTIPSDELGWAAETQLRAILGAALQALILMDRDCRIIAYNPVADRYLRELGRRKPRVGSSFRDYIPPTPPEVGEFFEAHFARALGGEVVRSERNLPNEQGDNWFEFLYSPIRADDGGVIGICFNAVPINARKQAEEALRQSEAHHRSLIENVWDIITVLSPDGTIVYDSPSVEGQLGWRSDELVGRSAFELIPPEDLPSVIEAFSSVLQAPGTKRRVEFRFAHKDGSFRLLEAVGGARRDADGNVIGVVAVSRDVTDRRRAEEALRSAERQSGQAEKLRALGQMASGIAHDLNQTLALIAGYSDLAHHTLEGAAPDLGRLREMLLTIAQAAMDGGDSVKRLLSFAREGTEGEPQAVELCALLREVAQLTAPRWRDGAQAEGRTIAVTVADGEAVAALGNPSALREALTNLIFNAVDALPRGGSIRLSAERQDDLAVVSVADDGVGMPPEVQARAFEPFFTTKGERGSGLGLAQVFGIVERHGGRISLHSGTGRGTTVRIELPAVEMGLSAPSSGDSAIGRRLRVLAVDDEVALARMTEASLAQDGHDVEVATSAEQAVTLLEAKSFDVVLSDLGMGAGRNGWQLAEEVRRRWPGTGFVLATGWAGEIDPATARARGVDAVVAKPYRLADLRRVLSEISRSA